MTFGEYLTYLKQNMNLIKKVNGQEFNRVWDLFIHFIYFYKNYYLNKIYSLRNEYKNVQFL